MIHILMNFRYTLAGSYIAGKSNGDSSTVTDQTDKQKGLQNYFVRINIFLARLAVSWPFCAKLELENN